MKPMLAGKCTDIKQLRYPLLASPKLDGIRAIVTPKGVLSRKLIRIPNKHVQDVVGKLGQVGYDGELIVGEPFSSTVYRDTSSGVMSVNGEPNVTFYVFDQVFAAKPGISYHERYTYLEDEFRKRSIRASSDTRIRLLTHHLVRSPDELDAYEQDKLSAGYEGVMLRSLDGLYKHGRSTEREQWLLKLKRFEDAEAVIVGFEELQHNENEATKDNLGRTKRSSHKENRVAGGVLGAFVVQSYGSKLTFGIGSGFTADERAKFWEARKHLLGKIVKYQYFPGGSKERPRFPTFLGFRSKIDL
jgi:DNA ligase-1